MNAMFVYEFARRLEGSRITVNGVHPGIVKRTGLGRDTRGALRILGSLLERSSRTLEPGDGADTPVWLATAPEVEGVTGRFFVRREQVTTARHTTDVERCARLWAESARLVGLPD